MEESGKRYRAWIVGGIILVIIIGVRVTMNLMARSEKAGNSRSAKVVVVAAGHPAHRTMSPKFRFSGTLEPVWQADVAAKVEGRIEAVLVEAGEVVTAGQTLALLEGADTQAELRRAEGAYYDAQAALDKAQADYQREAYLFAQGAVPREALDNAVFSLRSAEGKLQSAQGFLDAAASRQGGIEVTTPRAGVIQTRYYQEGYYAKAGTALFQIADISELRAKVAIPEGHISSVAVGSEVMFTIPSMAGEDKRAAGRIDRISPVAESGARTFAAEVSLDNRDGRLRGGVYAEAQIAALAKENVLTVPLSALVMREDQRTVFVVEEGIAVRRVLTTGYIGEEFVEVLEGVTEEDTIITGGLNKVRDGIRVRVEEGAVAE